MTSPSTQDVAQSVALAAARRFCGWHVTPVFDDDEVTLDGTGSPLLVLPTLRLVEVTGIVENGITIDVDDVHVSARGLVRKKSGARWSGLYGSIVVTMTHGFDEEMAADFDAAVASFADRRAGGDKPNVIGPVQWPVEALATGSAFSVVERSLLEQYRLESPA